MSKHLPVTPLPWKALRQSVLVGDSMQNAQYIVRTANAYPKLVAALRDIVDADPSPFFVNHRNLLRELGEL